MSAGQTVHDKSVQPNDALNYLNQQISHPAGWQGA